MMTPQDLQEVEFVKAVFGGYDMAPVDDFIERMTEDYAALYKENAVLKSKLKVLVEKVEEYRSTEDSMRMALLTAQKMGNEIVDEAKEKGDTILAEVNELAKQRSMELREKLAVEEARLAAAEKRTSDFSKKVLKLLADESSFIENLSELVIELPEPEAAPQIEAAAAPAVAGPVETVAPPEAEAPTAPEIALEEMQTSAEAYLAQEVSRMTAEVMGEAPAEPEPVPEPEPEPEPEPVPEPEPEAQIQIEEQPEPEAAKAAQEEDPFADFSRLFDQDHIDEAFAEEEAESAPQPAAKAAEAPVSADDLFAQFAPTASEREKKAEDEKIDIARSISASLGDTEDFKVDTESLWEDEGEPTTKRPKFDFDDLQFGSNFTDE